MLKENFAKLFENSFREHWEKAALSDYFKDDDFTYEGVAREIAKLHIIFDECRLKKGDKVALVGRNNTRWCICYLATVTYGGVIVPILQDFNANDVQHIVNHSDSVLMFAGDQLWETIDDGSLDNVRACFSLTDFECVYEKRGHSICEARKNIDKLFDKRYPNGFTREDVRYDNVSNSDLIVINYTSGTTGFSKGVMLTANNFVGNITFAHSQLMHIPGSRGLSFLPLAHAYGCTFDFLYPLAVGAHVTLLGKIPSPKILVEAFAKVRPRVVFMVPLIIEKIYKKQILPLIDKSLLVKFAMKIPFLDEKVYAKIREKLMEVFGGEFEQIIIGGAPLNGEVEEFLLRIKFPFTVGYGMTECAPLISYVHYTNFVPGTCGRPLPGFMEARIDSPDPCNQAGEIIVRGENVMSGYYKNKAATDEILGADGWLKTGDMGTMDGDNLLYIRGRSKAMILSSNGQNIYPEEIESKLNNMYCVMESLVVERDGRLVALVYPDYDQTDADGVSLLALRKIMDENRDELNKMVAPYERVSEVVLYPTEFEKTPKRSIRRYLYNV